MLIKGFSGRSCLIFFSNSDHFSQAEVSNLQPVGLTINENVLRLYIPVNETARVDVFQRTHQLHKHVKYQTARQLAPRATNHIPERLTLRVLHQDHYV